MKPNLRRIPDLINPNEISSTLTEKIVEGTGFFLEHQIATILEKAKWQVIHNRYYLDDINPIQREMDIVAYKVSQILNITVYTTMIISCKKSVENQWVFLTRESLGTEMNVKSYPLANWTNDEALDHQMKKNLWSDELTNTSNSHFDPLKELYKTDSVVFAFREYNTLKNQIGNDTMIYESISTLLKSQAYELATLIEGRNPVKSYYSFNLLSICDVPALIKAHCVEDRLESKIVSQINYINRFIINKKVNHGLISFVTLQHFELIIDTYNELHQANCKIVRTELEEFYTQNIFEDHAARELIFRDAKVSLIDDIYFYMSLELEGYDEVNLVALEDLTLASDVSEKTFSFAISPEDKVLLALLNEDIHIKELVGKWFEVHFYYTGPFFFFIDDLPF